MKYDIPAHKVMYGKERRYRLAKHIIYIMLALFFYVLMRVGIFRIWQPVFIIPLAIASAMYNDELSACLFAILCGYMTDIAYGFVFGFSAICLMAICVMTSLLVHIFLRANLFTYMVIVTVAVIIEFSADYFLNVVIPEIPHGDIILTMSVLPTIAATIAVSPAVYFLVRRIERGFGKNKCQKWAVRIAGKGEQ